MAEEEKNNLNQINEPDFEQIDTEELDTAGKSLSDALKLSFVVLKGIMVVLVILFLISGLRSVDSNEQALRLRFGRIRGVGEQRLLQPGAHWVWPYPIEELVRIPVGRRPTMAIDSFWFWRDRQGQPHGRNTLHPVMDGYTLTRNETHDNNAAEADYNIVHTRWQLVYRIEDPERFFRHMLIGEAEPGQDYYRVMRNDVEPLLKSIFEDAVVTTMVNYTIDEAITSQDRIPVQVGRLVQEKFEQIESGLAVVNVQLENATWPRQVDHAFLNYFRASQMRQQEITEARSYAQRTLNEAAGPGAWEFAEQIVAPDLDEQAKEMLWQQVSGEAQRILADSRAYRTQVVEKSRADALYLHDVLPEYHNHPRLFVQRLYQDAVEAVLESAQEKMILQPTTGGSFSEVRVLINRDPEIQSQNQQDQPNQQRRQR